MSEILSLRQLLDAPGAPLTNWREIVEKINIGFGQCTTSEQRVSLLAVFSATMDIAETTIVSKDLEKFKESRLLNYKIFIVQEATMAGNVCVETLDTITQREIAVGRMAPDNPLRELAVTSLAAPHLSHADLVAMEEARQHAEQTSVPTPAPDSWGRRLRGWIGRH